jgi:hypothetical protein
VERPSRSRTDYVVKARSQFKERSVATNVEIILPLPSDATAPVTRCSQVRERGLWVESRCGGTAGKGLCVAATALCMLCVTSGCCLFAVCPAGFSQLRAREVCTRLAHAQLPWRQGVHAAVSPMRTLWPECLPRRRGCL